ncbi:hypothetical protein G9A89_010223 [Geosiphon pyriformis]|nr:hypothetical protein G9A89_010223 [Geosiphon pyriformis]
MCPFICRQDPMESLKETDLTDKVIIITGASDGIGKTLARYISTYNPKRLILPVRDRAKGELALEYITRKTGTEIAECWDMDLADLESVRKFARKIVDEIGEVHVLINNAGFASDEIIKTKDEFETHFQVNYLSHFLLTNLLLHTMKKAGTPQFPSRIIHITSSLHRFGHIDFDNLQANTTNSIFEMYCNTKLMVTLFSKELNCRLAGTNLVSFAICPGFTPTKMGHFKGWKKMIKKMMSKFGYNRIAAFRVLNPTFNSPDLRRVGGKYFSKGRLAKPNKISDDFEFRLELWEVSERMLIA